MEMMSPPTTTAEAPNNARGRATRPSASRIPRMERGVALLSVAALSAICALVPLIFNRRYYYYDDTQNASIGFWSYAGQELLAGRFGWLQPELWVTGNGALDAQHGNWSPILMIVSIVAALSNNLGLFAIILKVILIVLASVGVYLLARTYVPPPWAVVAGLLVPLNGVTTYIDAPSWTVILFSLAVLPYLWWSLRRIDDFGPAPAVVFALLAIGLGFAQTVIMVAIVIGVALIETLWARRYTASIMTGAVGAAGILFALAVFLPGALSSTVTFRDSSTGLIGNDEVMGGSLSTLGLAQFPTARPEMNWTWGDVAPVPFAYVTWILVLLAFVRWSRDLPRTREFYALLIAGVAAFLLISGPTLLGPTRMPFRYYPLLALAAVIMAVIILSRVDASRWQVTPPRIVIATLVLGWGFYASLSNDPSHWLEAAGGLGVCLLATGVVLLSIRRSHPARRWHVPSAIAIGTIAVTLVQHALFPSPPTWDFGQPTARAALASVQEAAIAPSVVVGTLKAGDETAAEYARELLLGNAWLIGDNGVQNLYSSLGRKGYTDRFCLDYLGQSCPAYLTELFSPQPTTGLLLVDQLGINSIVLTNDVASARSELVPGLGDARAPEGWHVAELGAFTETWVRDGRAECVNNGVTWTTAGVDATLVSATAEKLVLKVNSVPSQGGQVVFCRMDWPGFETDSTGATIEEVDGYLLSLALTPQTAGTVVTINYEIPGKTAVLASLLGVLVLFAGSLVYWVVLRVRRREPTSDHDS